MVVHAANIQDRDGARLVINKLAGRFPELPGSGPMPAYRGKLVEWVRSQWGWDLEVVGAPQASAGLPCCPGAGWWNEPWPGWDAAGGGARTRKLCRKPVKPGSTSP